MSDSQPQYPIDCPKCHATKGYPFEVRTVNEKPGHIEIRLRCRDCAHEWVDVQSRRE